MEMRDELENIILDVSKRKPVTAGTVSAITGLPTNLVLMKMYMLEGYGLIERVTKKTVIFWGMPRNGHDKKKKQRALKEFFTEALCG